MGLALAALAYPVAPLPPPRTDAVEPRTRSAQFSAESVPYHRRPHPLELTGCSRLGLVSDVSHYSQPVHANARRV